MKLRKLMLPLFLLIAISSTIFLAGCPAPERRPAPPPPNMVPGPGPGGPAPGAPGVPGTDTRDLDRNGQMQDNTTGVRNIENMIERMPEVNDAWVVLTGNTALVGIDVNANVTGQRLNDLKAEITRKVKAQTNEITDVTVSADADSVTRIRNVAQGIADGRPISGFANEIAEITRRLAPTNR